ncbi:uncharacterized protein LOC132186993 [Corylus avellana]|uniref:uncharacterized protein LOC132186993 n=1 Tax=Corylus avellana TaxID=13451 RepID=UPI00286C81A4|nr:uncharacterized protein LOC132186993 [Corylus avellana]
MGDDLETLCGKISLIVGEKVGIPVSEGEIVADREKGERCLVGRIGIEKKVNKEAFRNVLSRIWRTMGSVVFKEMQDNVWLFEFVDLDDKKRVMEGRPWSFDRQILVLNDFDGSIPPAQMQFTHSPFWIQVHDMPLLCINKGVGTKIGESLGTLEDIDVAGDGGGWGRCLRIRVNIDLNNPVERSRALSMGGQKYWVTFRKVAQSRPLNEGMKREESKSGVSGLRRRRMGGDLGGGDHQVDNYSGEVEGKLMRDNMVAKRGDQMGDNVSKEWVKMTNMEVNAATSHATMQDDVGKGVGEMCNVEGGNQGGEIEGNKEKEGHTLGLIAAAEDQLSEGMGDRVFSMEVEGEGDL